MENAGLEVEGVADGRGFAALTEEDEAAVGGLDDTVRGAVGRAATVREDEAAGWARRACSRGVPLPGAGVATDIVGWIDANFCECRVRRKV
jgi:hypothetical protein